MQGGIQQGVGGEGAEAAAEAAGVGVQRFDRALGEEWPVDARVPEVVADEGRGLLQVERGEVAADADALGDGLEALEAEHGAQRGLAAEDQRERAGGVTVLDVLQIAQFVDHLVGELVALVEEEDGALALSRGQVGEQRLKLLTGAAGGAGGRTPKCASSRP